MEHSRSRHHQAKRAAFALLALVGGLATLSSVGSRMRPSLQSRVVEVVLRLMRMKQTMNLKDPQRTAADKVPNAIPSRRMRKRYVVSSHEVNGSTVYTIAPREGTSTQYIYYLHGGAYINGFAPEHWHFISRLVDAAGCRVIAPDYPLAPASHVGDVFALVLPLYRRLVSQVGAANLIVMGDSAGGGLSLALAQQLRDEGDPQPARLILLSPWLDVTMSNAEIAAIDQFDPMLGVQGARVDGKRYAGETAPTNPLVSPLYGDIARLAPISLFIGTHDVLLPDCRKLKAKAVAQNIGLDYHEYKDMVHVWMLIGVLPEAREALNDIVALIKHA